MKGSIHRTLNKILIILIVIMFVFYLIQNSFLFLSEYEHYNKDAEIIEKSKIMKIENEFDVFFKKIKKSENSIEVKDIVSLLSNSGKIFWILKFDKNQDDIFFELLGSSENLKLKNKKINDFKFFKLNKNDLDSILVNRKISKNLDTSQNEIYISNWIMLKDNLLLGMGDVILNTTNLKKTEKIYAVFLKIKINILFNTVYLLLAIVTIFFVFRWINKNIRNYEEQLKSINIRLFKKNKELQERLNIDKVTSLPSIASFKDDLEKTHKPKLILFAIDSFKKMLDYYGNEFAEYVLKYLAAELKIFADKEKMKLYKTDLNIFALLEDGILDIERYEELASSLIKQFKGLMIRDPKTNLSVEIFCTIGFCLEGGKDVFRKATIALEKAQAQERDFLGYFKKIDGTDEYIRYLEWSNIVKSSLEQDKIIPFFQPIFDRNKNIVKYECLVRILNKDDEVISPAMFLESSRQAKLYSEISKTMIEKSFKAIQGTKKVISINMLARDMSDGNVSNYLVRKIEKYNVANQVVIEVLEDETINKMERVANFINKIKRMGVKVAIDDFGDGYSNFSYMLQFHPDYLKIDGSLIKKIDIDTSSYAIVNAIVAFAKQLNIKTIAEYVHSKEVFETCLQIGIDEFQGFYLAPPRASI